MITTPQPTPVAVASTLLHDITCGQLRRGWVNGVYPPLEELKAVKKSSRLSAEPKFCLLGLIMTMQHMFLTYVGYACCLSCVSWPLQDRLHGGSLRWWVWVEDPNLNRLHHAEAWTLTKKVWCTPLATSANMVISCHHATLQVQSTSKLMHQP